MDSADGKAVMVHDQASLCELLSAVWRITAAQLLSRTEPQGSTCTAWRGVGLVLSVCLSFLSLPRFFFRARGKGDLMDGHIRAFYFSNNSMFM